MKRRSTPLSRVWWYESRRDAIKPLPLWVVLPAWLAIAFVIARLCGWV